MPQSTSEQDAKHWKQKYYKHLDLLDHKEKDWHKLESVLKKTVQRLSIAAEGQYASMDQHLHDIRSIVKNQLNVVKLENSLDDISALLLKMADNQVQEDKKIMSTLAHLLENIEFPDSANRKKNKLVSKLSRSTDKGSDDLVEQVQSLLAVHIKQNSDDDIALKPAPAKSGLLKNLFASKDKNPDNTDSSENIKNIDHDTLTGKPAGQQMQDLQGQSRSENLSPGRQLASSETGQPSAQEILIRLLEQLTVPPDLHQEVDSLKQRIENESSDTSWKPLLKDVAQLVNTLRNRMQEEKQAFETFLQQITGRLREMDHALSTGNASLDAAEAAGGVFDAAVSAQVQDIHDDMNTADDLDDLKGKVEKRLNIVSDHITEYRINEQARYADAQKNTEDMRSRLLQLERESGDLKNLIQEKSREAMFDVLTGIPNRLAYEKKAMEEIARCKRFSSPLSMAVWDIDLFKQVNDTYGHKVGDKVLQAVAQLLQERMRETDFIARYGGEEFVMFLPGAEENEALKLADALRERIASIRFNNEDEVIKITVSCGISDFTGKDSHETMFERADRALYAAKRNGRNQCLKATSMKPATANIQ